MSTAPAQRGSDRNYFRLAVQIPIELDVAGIPAPVPATLVDISEGGCKITAKSIVLKDVAVEFELPRRDKKPLKLCGKVCHIDFKPTTRTFDYGIQYVGLRPADTDNIYQFIVEEQRRRLQTRDSGSDGAPGRTTKEERKDTVLR